MNKLKILHKYFMRAHILYRHYAEQMEIVTNENMTDRDKEFAKIKFWLYLDLWYWSLAVLIEVYKKMAIKSKWGWTWGNLILSSLELITEGGCMSKYLF